MENLTYVTGNYGKYVSVKELFDIEGIDIYYANIDTKELDINDIKEISKDKAKQAYEKIKSPVFVADSGFYIRSYPGIPNYPGAFVKRSGIANDVDNLLDIMKNVDDRYCFFLDCLTYYDGDNYYSFLGKSEGLIAREKKGDSIKRAKSNLWYVFMPKNYHKTLAEMNDIERLNRKDDRTSATSLFIKWYKENKLSIKTKNLIKK